MIFHQKKYLFSFVFLLEVILGSISLPFRASASTFYVTTFAPAYVGVDCAVLSGYVGGTDTDHAYRWFEYGPEGYFNSRTTGETEEAKISTHGGFGRYYQIVTDLKPNTSYSYHALAGNIDLFSTTDVYDGYEISFQTKVGTPTSCENYPVGQPVVPQVAYSTNQTSGTSYKQITTQPATNITETSATLNALASPLPNAVNYGWFEWGTTPDLGNYTARIVMSNASSVVFSQNVTDVKSGTTYFFKPVIQNSSGTSEGLVYSFRTQGVGLSFVSALDTGDISKIAKNPVHSKKITSIAKTSTTTEDSLAAAALLQKNNSGFWSSSGWAIFFLNLLFGIIFLFLYFFSRKQKDTEEQSKTEGELVLAPMIIPQKPVILPASVNKKGEAPDNLPF